MRLELPASHAVTDLYWLATSFVGDLVLTTGAIEVAASVMPLVRQHVITTPVGASVFAGSEPIVDRIVFDKRRAGVRAFSAVKAAVARRLVDGAKGAVLMQVHGSPRSSLLAKYLALPTVTYEESAYRGHAAREVPRVGVCHEVVRVALLLEALGVPRSLLARTRPRLLALPLDIGTPWQKKLASHQGPILGLAPGSVWGTKRWEPAGFAKVAQALGKEFDDLLVVLIGSAQEVAVAQEVATRVDQKVELLNLVGATDLYDLRRMMPRLTALVANDSAAVHYASAFDVPTVAVFGATIPAMGFGPLASGSEVVGVPNLACRPCGAHGPMRCPLGHFRCMRDLQPEEVAAAARRALLYPKTHEARPAQRFARTPAPVLPK